MTAALMEWLASASVLIVVVLLLRWRLGGRISAGLRYGLWAVVLIRLLVPVSFSLLSVAVPQLPKWDPPEVMQEETIYVLPVSSLPLEQSGVYVAEDGTLGDPNSFGYPRLTDNGERVVRYADKISPLELLKWVWIAGTAGMGIVLVVSNLRFSRRLRRVRQPLEGTNAPVPVYVAPALPSPCLVGLFFPAVYVTEEAVADPAMLRHVLAHELTHYNHRDHLWSVLRGAALAVHWWNPLVWLAVVCSRRDGELACDEGALKQLGDSERAAYGETLLTLVTAKVRPADLLSFTTTMSGGKRSLRERIQRIAHQPKQLASAVAAVVIVLSVSVLVAFGQARWIDPDSVTGFTAFKASSYTVTPGNTIVYTPADLQKDLQSPKNAVFVSREDGMKLIYLINAHGKRVYGQGDLTLNGQEHYFVKIDCTDGGFYLLDYWYWNGFSFNPLHFGEDDFTTLITYFDADGNAGTTWQMDYSFDLIYSPGWSSAAVKKTSDTAASGSDVTDAAAWRSPDIVLTVDGVIELGYDIPGGGVEIVRSNPVPAPREWATLDPLTRDSRTRATALEGLPIIWAELVNPSDGWLVACYGRGVTVAGTYVYKTEDGGMNWTEVAMPGTNWHIADVAFLNPDRLIVAQRLSDGVPCMITKDRGETWEKIELPDVQVLSIGTIADTVYMDIGKHEGDPATYSMISYDMGDSWTISSPTGLRQFVQPDLDHDGKPDTLNLSTEPDPLGWSYDGTIWTLQCSLSGGGTWEIEGRASLPGENAVFLYQMDGEDYLLVYTPNFWHGQGYYDYRLIWLDGGREVVVQKNSVEFDTRFRGEADPESFGFEPKAIAAFMDEVNTLLAGSVQLVNTNIYLEQVFASHGRLYDDLYWLDDKWREDGLTLLEILRNYGSYFGDHPDDAWSMLADLLEGLTEEVIPMFDGDTAELVRLLRAARRGSRFYPWRNEADAYVGHGGEEVDYTIWDLPLADGSALWLLACEERPSVLMIYETQEETISAYYTAPELREWILDANRSHN